MKFDLANGTALVTGASSGIGAAFARHLAQYGCSLVLVARREDRLNALAAELEQQHGIPADVLPADLASETGIAAVEERIKTLPHLNLLVNNAGFGTFTPFAKIDLAEHDAMLSVHIEAVLRACHAALPGMLARRQGGIINVASVSAFMATPGSVTYSASKAYLVSFSEGLSTEIAGSGVTVQALCPGFTRTEIHDGLMSGDNTELFNPQRIPNWLWMQPEQVAEASLRALGRGGPVVVVPGLLYQIGAAVARSGLFSPSVVGRLKTLFMGGKN